ncbi:hypothetical protein AB0L05_29030 [Nonomuraea pusilla]|uniref:hypothetical protein n=1 Tax=Nonomuraea pusilla TaxID=46177 RepID=UPI003331FE28
MSEEPVPEGGEQPPEPQTHAHPHQTPDDPPPVGFEDDSGEPSPEDAEQQRRFRLSGLPSAARYDVSGQGANVAVGGSQVNYQQFTVHGRPARVATPLTPEHLRDIRACTVATVSRTRLAERLCRSPVMLLRGKPGSGRRTTAYAALLDWIGDDQDARVGMINGGTELSELTGEDLAGMRGGVIEPSDEVWAKAQHEMLTHLRSVAHEADCRIVVLLDKAGAGGELLVDHEPPPALDVFQAWITYRLGEPDAWKEHEFDAHDVQLGELLDGCSPGQAEEKAHEAVHGLRRGLRIDDLLGALKKPVRQRLQQAFASDASPLSRCFLISSGAFHDLTETVVSRAALRLDDIIRGQENERTRPGPPVWEPLQSLLIYEGLRTEPRLAQGDGHRIRLRADVREQVLQVAWEEVPALRGVLHDWLRELTQHEDQRVATRAAQAVAQLAACDFDTVRAEFLDPWSQGGYRDRELAKATLEAAWSLNPDLARRTHALLENWSTGNYRKRMTVAAVYGSQIGIHAIDEALASFKRVVEYSGSVHLHVLVAGSIAEVYAEATAERILRELKQWTTSRSDGLLRTAALAPTRLAYLPPAQFPGRPALSDDATREAVVTLLCHALEWSKPSPSPRRTPPVWHLLARWAREDFCQPVLEEVIRRTAAESPHLRLPLLLNLRAWRARGTITAERHLTLRDLLSRGGDP